MPCRTRMFQPRCSMRNDVLADRDGSARLEEPQPGEGLRATYQCGVGGGRTIVGRRRSAGSGSRSGDAEPTGPDNLSTGSSAVRLGGQGAEAGRRSAASRLRAAGLGDGGRQARGPTRQHHHPGDNRVDRASGAGGGSHHHLSGPGRREPEPDDLTGPITGRRDARLASRRSDPPHPAESSSDRLHWRHDRSRPSRHGPSMSRSCSAPQSGQVPCAATTIALVFRR